MPTASPTAGPPTPKRRPLGRAARWAAISAVRVYQLVLSPAVRQFLGPGPRCRFHPTCSNYAIACFREHPFHRAFYLAVRRLLRCHPFHEGGLDPVPPPSAPRPGRGSDPRPPDGPDRLLRPHDANR